MEEEAEERGQGSQGASRRRMTAEWGRARWDLLRRT